MLHHLKTLSKDSFAYSLSNIVTRASSFILLPIYTRIFQPSEVGTVNLVNVTFFFVSTIALFCLDSAAVVFYWKDDVERKEKIFSSWFWFVFLVNLGLFLVVWLFSAPISMLVLGNRNLGNLFVLAFLSGLFNILPLLYSNYLRIKREPVTQLRISVITASLTFVFTLVFVYFLRIGIVGIFYAQAVSALASALICLTRFRSNLQLRDFDKAVLKKMLHFSLPVIPSAMAFWLSNSVGLYAISYYIDKHEVGIYNVANSIASIVNIVIAAVSQAVLPFALSISKDENAREVYARILQLYFAVLCASALLLCVFAKEFLLLIATKTFAGGELVLTLLVFNSILIGSNTIIGIGLNIAQKMRSLLHISLISAAANLTFIFVLVPLIGKEGAAIAAIGGSLFLVALTMRSSQLYYPVPYRYSEAILTFVLTLGAGLLIHYSFGEVSALSISFKVAIYGALAVLLFVRNKPLFQFTGGFK